MSLSLFERAGLWPSFLSEISAASTVVLRIRVCNGAVYPFPRGWVADRRVRFGLSSIPDVPTASSVALLSRVSYDEADTFNLGLDATGRVRFCLSLIP